MTTPSPDFNIRDFLGSFTGKTVADITQHDQQDWEDDHRSFIMVMFGDGTWVKFFIGEGFEYDDDSDDEHTFIKREPDARDSDDD